MSIECSHVLRVDGRKLRVMCTFCGDILCGYLNHSSCSCGKITMSATFDGIFVYWPGGLDMNKAFKLQNNRRIIDVY